MHRLAALLFSVLGFAVLPACHPSDPYPQLGPPLPPNIVTRVRLIHFSDYHSHAVPYFSGHQPGQAGMARALNYVKQQKAMDPNLLVLNGGDMWNSGTPAWSDKYYKDCTEWRWWNGFLTAMAFGNHDVDYGWDAFAHCQKESQYPVLSGNFVDASGNLLLTALGKPYLVQQIGGVRIGLFALAGPDFVRLLKPANLPAGASFTDPMLAARNIVRILREQEKVDAVIFFGHEDRETDFAMASQVPGIDLILGTHSHFKGDFQLIPGTQTYFISPFQYLNYLSQVELSFLDGKLTGVSGRLVQMSQELPEDAALRSEVARMQKELEADPQYKDRFQVIGQAAVELDFDNIDRGESVLGDFVMDTVRTGTPAHAGFSTASSFRASIPPGDIRMEDYLTALPYKNKILALSLLGAQVQELLDLSASKRASDNFAVTSGLKYTLHAGKASSIRIAKDPAARSPDYEELRPEKTYTIMASDFIANIATGYKEIFAKASSTQDTGLILNEVVIDYIRKQSPVSAKLEGRIVTGGDN